MKVDRGYLRKAIGSAPLLPQPGNLEVTKIARSHIAALDDVESLRRDNALLIGIRDALSAHGDSSKTVADALETYDKRDKP